MFRGFFLAKKINQQRLCVDYRDRAVFQESMLDDAGNMLIFFFLSGSLALLWLGRKWQTKKSSYFKEKECMVFFFSNWWQKCGTRHIMARFNSPLFLFRTLWGEKKKSFVLIVSCQSTCLSKRWFFRKYTGRIPLIWFFSSLAAFDSSIVHSFGGIHFEKKKFSQVWMWYPCPPTSRIPRLSPNAAQMEFHHHNGDIQLCHEDFDESYRFLFPCGFPVTPFYSYSKGFLFSMVQCC